MKHILVVGGDYLTYLVALFLCEKLKSEVPVISLLELPRQAEREPTLLQTLGSMRNFHTELRFSEPDFIRATQAEINLGFEYDGFLAGTAPRLFADAQYGFNLNNRRFHRLFDQLSRAKPDERLEDYCLTAKLARLQRFTPPSPNPKSLFSTISYGYRLTDVGYMAYLRQLVAKSSVQVYQDGIVEVSQSDSGFIESLRLESGHTLQADLIIDTSADGSIRSVLDSEPAKRPLFPVNARWAQSQRIEASTQVVPYSQISAHASEVVVAGNHAGSRYQQIFNLIEPSPGAAPTETAWVDEKPWVGNCIAMGKAFTNRRAILIDNSHLHQSALYHLLELWPRTADLTVESRRYNAQVRMDLERVRDLDLLHLALGMQRQDLLPEALRDRVDSYARTGKAVFGDQESLHEAQWPVLFHCLGVAIEAGACGVPVKDTQWLESELLKIKTAFAKAAAAAPRYADFIASVHR